MILNLLLAHCALWSVHFYGNQKMNTQMLAPNVPILPILPNAPFTPQTDAKTPESASPK